MKKTITIRTATFGDIPVDCEIVGGLAVQPLFVSNGEEYFFSPHFFVVTHPVVGCTFGTDEWYEDEARALALELGAVKGIESLGHITNPRERLKSPTGHTVTVKDVMPPEAFQEIRQILAKHRAMKQRDFHLEECEALA